MIYVATLDCFFNCIFSSISNWYYATEFLLQKSKKWFDKDEEFFINKQTDSKLILPNDCRGAFCSVGKVLGTFSKIHSKSIEIYSKS